MTITPTDIKILASADMSDADTGGGFMAPTAVQDASENNVFPDLSSVDRVFGRFQLRKVYPFVQTNTAEALLGANAIIEAEPADANIATWLFAAADEAEQRSKALARLQQCHWAAATTSPCGTFCSAAAGVAARSRVAVPASSIPPVVGTVLMVYDGTTSTYGQPILVTAVTEIASGDPTFGYGFGTLDGGTRVFAITYAGTVTNGVSVVHAQPSNSVPRLHATAAAASALSVGATTIDVDSVLVPVVPVPVDGAPGDSATIGIDPTDILPAGRAVGFRGGDVVVVHHSAETTPATVSNGTTINCARTNLSRAVLVDAAGKTLLSGYTVNLAAGTVTVTDTTGWTQPIKARHTIEEVVGLQRTGYPESRQTATSGSGVSTAGPFTLSDLLVMYCGRPNVGQIKVYSKSGQDITDIYNTGSGYAVGENVNRMFSVDAAHGTVTVRFASGWASSIIASFSPVTIVASGSSSTAAAAATTAQATPNRLTLNRGLSRAFPSGTLVSSAILLGDLRARVGTPFSQETWANVWSDTQVGSDIVGQYDYAGRPIVVTNDGAATDRWAIIFTSATAFRCVSEQRGQIATGDINTAFAPVNPATGKPFFTISQFGWGSGWNSGNVLRFNTAGAASPVWVARVTLPSAPTSTPDSLTIAVRGDVDA